LVHKTATSANFLLCTALSSNRDRQIRPIRGDSSQFYTTLSSVGDTFIAFFFIVHLQDIDYLRIWFTGTPNAL